MSSLDFCKDSANACVLEDHITVQSGMACQLWIKCDTDAYTVIARSTDWARFVQSMDSSRKVQIKHGSVPGAAQSMNCLDPRPAHNIHTQEKQSSQRLHLKRLYALPQRLRIQQESTFQIATHFLSSYSSPLGRQQSETHTKQPQFYMYSETAAVVTQ